MGKVYTRNTLNDALTGGGWSTIFSSDGNRCVTYGEAKNKTGLHISQNLGNYGLIHNGIVTIKSHTYTFECSANYNPYTGSNKSVIACYKDGELCDRYDGDDELRGMVVWATDWYEDGGDEIWIGPGEGFPISNWEIGEDLITFKWYEDLTPDSTTENGVLYDIESA